jgi:hypothetical protein
MQRARRPKAIRTSVLISCALLSILAVAVASASTVSKSGGSAPVNPAKKKIYRKASTTRCVTAKGAPAAPSAARAKSATSAKAPRRKVRVTVKPCPKKHLVAKPKTAVSLKTAGTGAPTLSSLSSPPPGSSSSSPVQAPLTGEGSEEESSAPLSPPLEPEPEPEPEAGPFRFFAPSSVWNEPLAADAPLDPQSAELVHAFAAEVQSEEHAKVGPWINTTSDSVPVYTVEAEQPTVPVSLEFDLEPALVASWRAVPLPAEARAAAGTDKPLVVWQPSTDRMWEFWRLEETNGAWSASWGGSMQHVSVNPGVFGPEAWPGAQPWWGATATSLPLVGGLMTFQDLQQGKIEHALAVAVPEPRAGVYALPAQRDDGTSESPLALPEGAHLRLDPTLDLSTLHLPRLTLMMAEAAQRYGIVIRDKAANIAFFGQDPTPTGSNPYTAPKGYFQGKYPNQLLNNFPWSHLQVLDMTLREG